MYTNKCEIFRYIILVFICNSGDIFDYYFTYLDINSKEEQVHSINFDGWMDTSVKCFIHQWVSNKAIILK